MFVTLIIRQYRLLLPFYIIKKLIFTFNWRMILVPRPMSSPEVSFWMVKEPPAEDFQMYCSSSLDLETPVHICAQNEEEDSGIQFQIQLDSMIKHILEEGGSTPLNQ